MVTCGRACLGVGSGSGGARHRDRNPFGSRKWATGSTSSPGPAPWSRGATRWSWSPTWTCWSSTSHITPAAARGLIAGIEQITDKPIRTLVNSHFHYDHSHGNQAFGPGVRVVGHEYTRRKMATAPLAEHTFVGSSGRDKQALEDLRAALEAAPEEERAALEAQISVQAAHVESTAEIDPVAPDTTLLEKMTLFHGGREIELHFLGPRPHRWRCGDLPAGGAAGVHRRHDARRTSMAGRRLGQRVAGPPWNG